MKTLSYKKNQLIWCIAFAIPGVGLFCLFFLIPMITVLITGFTSWDGLLGDITFVGFENYIHMFTLDRAFGTALSNVAKWSALGIFVQIPMVILLSLFLARKPIGWRFVRSVYMLPIIISQAVIAVIFRYIFNAEFGLFTGIIRLFDENFFYNWFGSPTGAFWVVTMVWLPYAAISMLIIMAELLSIPPELFEAATIDGATSIQVDRYIKFPLIKKSIGIVVFLTVTGVFKQFTNIFLLTDGGPSDATVNISLLIYRNISSYYRAGYANAMSTILILLGVIVMVICNRLFSMNKNMLD